MKTIQKIMISMLCLVGGLAHSQDIEKGINDLKAFNLKNFLKDGLQITGGVSANQTYYQAWGDNRRTPYSYIYSGNINIGILGKINIPLSFSFTNQNSTINTPFSSGFPRMQSFNRLQFKPKYRSHTFYLGTSSMFFSQYTLSGHRFNGFGYEYRSNKSPFYGSIMYGKLLKAVRLDSVNTTIQNKPAFTRMGWSGKVGYKQKQDFVELIYFEAKDREQSLPYRLDNYNIFPEANIALSARGQKVFLNKLFIESEITRTKIFKHNVTFSDKMTQILGSRKINRSKRAIKSSIKYKAKQSEFGFEYSKVDPLYRTFGGYFFNADLETFAIKSANHLMSNKLVLITDVGYQRDNLDHSKPQASNRWVWTIDGNFTPNEKLNMGISYSTFSNYSNFQNNFRYLTTINPYQELDTLNYRQINKNISGVIRYQLPSTVNIKKTISMNHIYQSGNDTQGGYSTKNTSNNFNINYGVFNENKKYSASVGLSYVQNQTNRSTEKMVGPVTSFNGKLFNQKLDWNGLLSYTFSANRQIENLVKTSQSIFLSKLGVQSTINKIHRLSLFAVFFSSTNRIKAPTELILNFGYTYQFKLPKTQKPK